MVRKQVLRARKHSRESLLKNVKSESDQKKLTFNITYYTVFQNVINILQGYLTLTLRRLFIFYNAEYAVKLLMLVRQKRNLEQDLIIIKVHSEPIEENVKYHSSVFMNIMDNTVIMELMIGSSQ